MEDLSFLTNGKPEPVPLMVYKFAQELRKYKCPLANMTVEVDDKAREITIRLSGIMDDQLFQTKQVYEFGYITCCENTKMVDMAYHIALDMYIDCVRSCLRQSRR